MMRQRNQKWYASITLCIALSMPLVATAQLQEPGAARYGKLVSTFVTRTPGAYWYIV